MGNKLSRAGNLTGCLNDGLGEMWLPGHCWGAPTLVAELLLNGLQEAREGGVAGLRTLARKVEFGGPSGRLQKGSPTDLDTA